MKKSDVIAHFGSKANTAKALETDPSNITRWPDEVPEFWACKLHLITDGILKWRRRDYPAVERLRK